MKNELKYNIGDKVAYVDLHKTVSFGIIVDIKQTDEYEWNKDKIEDLYLISTCPYLRREENIIGFAVGH